MILEKGRISSAPLRDFEELGAKGNFKGFTLAALSLSAERGISVKMSRKNWHLKKKLQAEDRQDSSGQRCES